MGETVHGRQQKCCRFARTGLGGGKQIVTGEDLGDGLSLNGRGSRIAQGIDRLEHEFGEPELIESGELLGCGLDRVGCSRLVRSIKCSLRHGLAGFIHNLGVGDARYRIAHMLLFLICTLMQRGQKPRERA